MPYDNDLEIDVSISDMSPWIYTPSSSRVSELRYDHGNKVIQVKWTNDKNIGYVYAASGYEQYRSFARAASRGKYINKALNALPYRLITESELEPGVNPRRRGLTSRVKN